MLILSFIYAEIQSRNPANYWSLLNYLFSPVDGADAAGLNYVRIPIGASDFSSQGWSSVILTLCDLNWTFNIDYSLDDSSADTSFSSFNIKDVPSYVFVVLGDIKSINNYLKIHLIPWSPVRLREYVSTSWKIDFRN